MESMTTGAADSVTTIYNGSQVSDIVVTTVAQAKGVDPLELEPLYDVVDPDALDSIFAATDASSASSMELSFTMADCEVVVRGDGEVSVTPPTSDESSITITHLDD